MRDVNMYISHRFCNEITKSKLNEEKRKTTNDDDKK